MPRTLYSTTATTAREWWWLSGEQTPPVDRTQWQRYAVRVEEKLSQRYDEMRSAGRDEGLVLDLDPLPYQVWRTRSIKVTNPVAPVELRGRRALCGLLEDLWMLPSAQLPASPLLRHGTVVAGFFQFVQVLSEQARWLDRLNAFLSDPRGTVWPHPEIPYPPSPRPCVVLLIEDDKPNLRTEAVGRFCCSGELPGGRGSDERAQRQQEQQHPCQPDQAPPLCTEDVDSPATPPCAGGRRCEWWRLTGEQRTPVAPEQWEQYDAATQAALNSTYEAFRRADGGRPFAFNIHGTPYQIRQGKSVKVENQSVPNLYGWRAVAGLRDTLWNLPPEQLPRSALLQRGRVVAGHFQVHRDQLDLLEEFEKFLVDPSKPSWGTRSFPKRCVVLLIVSSGVQQNADVTSPVVAETLQLDAPTVRKKQSAMSRGNSSGSKLQSTKQAWDAPQQETSTASCSVL